MCGLELVRGDFGLSGGAVSGALRPPVLHLIQTDGPLGGKGDAVGASIRGKKYREGGLENANNFTGASTM